MIIYRPKSHKKNDHKEKKTVKKARKKLHTPQYDMNNDSNLTTYGGVYLFGLSFAAVSCTVKFASSFHYG